ncbi:MAG: beta-N-acetylhexosaminidase [Lamprobacter sp.]|uniref:beta-N-acetylhexosaminidase n=1 Tax=Lamprobacter sp. TaxID=3100796 RepID=UPI002B263C3E|nr:beta-N-acetylhexosaminidase [Lamprobacter sp.]MEA3643899.1 beta-N-acetylhexosaminidase [Lamprobacter sp.]
MHPRRAFLQAALGLTATAPWRSLQAQDLPWWRWPLEQRLAQLLMVGFRGADLSADDPIVRDLSQHGLGGVVLFDRDGRNIRSPQQLRALTRTLSALSSTPLLIGVDQEGGRIARLKPRDGFPATVSAQTLGQLDDPIQTERAADAIAQTLADNGLNLNFAPVVDLNRNPDNPIIGRLERSFSSDPHRVVQHAAAVVRAQQRRGILSTLKHFPGHGSAGADSHTEVVDVTDTWSAQELTPYAHLIQAGYRDLIMSAHIRNARLDPRHPATLSWPILTGLLRQRLGFRGVVISDDLQMDAIAQHHSPNEALIGALNAGVDVLLIANHRPYDPDRVPKTLAILRQALIAGRLSVSRVNAACARILALKARYRWPVH